MRLLAGPWDVPHHPARPLLLFRGLCALLAFDAWALMLQHGGRYGMGSFNVAHFDLVDRLVPMPSPGLYLALVGGAGFYAFAGAFGLLDRFGALALWGLYTLSWMLSMHDSYQHHYLLSWLLAFAIFAPTLSVHDCLSPEVRARESSFPLVTIGCGLVYVFTAVSKSSAIWRSGAVMRKLTGDGGPLMLPALALAELGLPNARAWHFAAVSVMAFQIVIALGFFMAIVRDAWSGSRRAGPSASNDWPGWACGVALAFASAFHVSTELSPSFAIGWFSYYMLWTGWICLIPVRWLLLLVNTIERFRTHLARLRVGPRWAAGAALLSVSSSLLFWSCEELPGLGLASLVFAGVWLASARRPAPDIAERRVALNLLPALAVATLFCTLSLTHVRFDYYRRAAGELSRMGQLEAALELYRRAERHAPNGQSRMTKIRELEQSLDERLPH